MMPPVSNLSYQSASYGALDSLPVATKVNGRSPGLSGGLFRTQFPSRSPLTGDSTDDKRGPSAACEASAPTSLLKLRRGLCASAAFLAATAAHADTFRWGAEDQSIIETYQGEGNGHIATIEFRNNLTFSADSDYRVQLSEAGQAFTVLIEQGEGKTPDRMTVIPPSGFVAIPPSILVDEYDAGSIEIFDAAEVPSS